MDKAYVEGFSKWDKQKKIEWLSKYYLDDESHKNILEQYWHPDKKLQDLHDGFIENPVSNFYLPFAIAPNFLINGKLYAVPMVIEESSVVAAASKAAKFWYPHGGFTAEVVSTVKTGHIHLLFYAEFEKLKNFFDSRKEDYLNRLKPFTENMERRGGGILSVELKDLTGRFENYYAIEFKFDTADSMGANFINTVLEEWAEYMEEDYPQYGDASELEIIMRILSNYNPECTVKVRVQAPVEKLQVAGDKMKYAERFVKALEIARVNIYRAVTHNKGIMNGIDAVVLATGNDFRAIEAGAHAFASKNGSYKSLSEARIENGRFIFEMEIPLTLGVVGGMTRTHPLARTALHILGNPSAKKLMEITAAVGLAQNFSAVNSLITEGIQKGHMKMHLNNILLQFDATEEERRRLYQYFADKKVHVKAVKEQLEVIRKKHKQ
jgi:hydroxymethylglutaryl-CoA reductase